MSTLSAIANRQAHLGKPDSEQYVQKMHSKLVNKLKTSKMENIVLNQQALQLQEFLRLLKYYQQKGFSPGKDMSDAPFSSLWSIMEQQALMQKLYEIHPKLFTKKYLVIKGDTSYEIGANLERGISQVIKSFEAIATKNEYGKSNFRSGVGGAHTQIPDLLEETGDIMKKEFNYFYEYTQQEAKKYRSEEIKYAKTMNSIQGKIDNTGFFANLEFLSECTNIEKDIILALNESTFTDKNYISGYDIHFGNTNPFRVFMTVTPDSGETALIRFARMYNCFVSHSFKQHQQGPVYFYRLRAIYELTGEGMQYVNLASNPILAQITGGFAKFLIWNNPFGAVYVIPTQNIVKEIFEKSQELIPDDYMEALYGPIEIPQTSLAEAAPIIS